MEGGDPELAEAIKARRWREMATLSTRQRALCTVAEKLSAEPTRIVEQDWQPLRDPGFGDETCLEVAHVMGIFNYLTWLADGFGRQLDPGTAAASSTGARLDRLQEDEG
jgi:alkylhydroperoxidase family enzyme